MKSIIIRKAVFEDLSALAGIYDYARAFMASTGNPDQWVNGYPSLDDLNHDIEEESLYVCEGKDRKIIAAFCFLPGPDPTYSLIKDGEWLNDLPYHVIHRLASDGSQKGIAQACLDWCFEQDSYIRVDTHKNNLIMQHILESYGFQRCGIIYAHDGTPRLAYQFLQH